MASCAKMTQAMTGSFSAAVLAGGESRRMGRDKAFLPDDAGRTQWELQCERLERLNPLECLVSANAAQTFPKPGIRVVVDAQPHQGPLGGIASCLRAMSPDATHLLVLAVDMPRMPTQFLQELIARAARGRGAIFQRAGRFEPLAAVYPREALPVAEAALAQDMLKLQDWVALLAKEGRMLALPAPENAEEAFFNMNSMQDLKAP